MIDELMSQKKRHLLEGKDILSQVKNCREIKGSKSSIFEIELQNFELFKETKDDEKFFKEMTKKVKENNSPALFILKEVVESGFQSELNLVKAIRSHPKIEGLVYLISYAVYKTDALEVAYILMERGDSNLQQFIETRVSEGNPITSVEFISIMNQTITALAEMQDKKIAHNDIKPANILVFQKPKKPIESQINKSSRGIAQDVESNQSQQNKNQLTERSNEPEILVKICDIGSGQSNASTNKSVEQRGTFSYMAPEILEAVAGKINIYKQDVFSLGLCFVYMILQKTSGHYLQLRQPLKAILNYKQSLDILQDVLTEWIRIVNQKQGNNKLIKNILSSMLTIDIQKRPDFFELRYQFLSLENESFFNSSIQCEIGQSLVLSIQDEGKILKNEEETSQTFPQEKFQQQDQNLMLKSNTEDKGTKLDTNNKNGIRNIFQRQLVSPFKLNSEENEEFEKQNNSFYKFTATNDVHNSSLFAPPKRKYTQPDKTKSFHLHIPLEQHKQALNMDSNSHLIEQQKQRINSLMHNQNLRHTFFNESNSTQPYTPPSQPYTPLSSNQNHQITQSTFYQTPKNNCQSTKQSNIFPQIQQPKNMLNSIFPSETNFMKNESFQAKIHHLGTNSNNHNILTSQSTLNLSSLVVPNIYFETQQQYKNNLNSSRSKYSSVINKSITNSILNQQGNEDINTNLKGNKIEEQNLGTNRITSNHHRNLYILSDQDCEKALNPQLSSKKQNLTSNQRTQQQVGGVGVQSQQTSKSSFNKSKITINCAKQNISLTQKSVINEKKLINQSDQDDLETSTSNNKGNNQPSLQSFTNLSNNSIQSSQNLNEEQNEQQESVSISSFVDLQKFNENFQQISNKNKKLLTLTFLGISRNSHFGMVDIIQRLQGLQFLSLIFIQQKKQVIDWVLEGISHIQQSLGNLSITFRDCDYSLENNKSKSSNFAYLPSEQKGIPKEIILNMKFEGKIINLQDLMQSIVKKNSTILNRVKVFSIELKKCQYDVYPVLQQVLSSLKNKVKMIGVELGQSILCKQEIQNLFSQFDIFNELELFSLNLSSLNSKLDSSLCISFPTSLKVLHLSMCGIYLTSTELVKLTKAIKSCPSLSELHLFFIQCFKKDEGCQLMLFLQDIFQFVPNVNIFAESSNLTDQDFSTYQSGFLQSFKLETFVLSVSKNLLSFSSFQILSSIIKMQPNIKTAVINFPRTFVKAQVENEFKNEPNRFYTVDCSTDEYDTITVKIDSSKRSGHKKITQKVKSKLDNEVHQCFNLIKDFPCFVGAFCITCFENHNVISSESYFCQACILSCHQNHRTRPILEFSSSNLYCRCKDIPDFCEAQKQIDKSINTNKQQTVPKTK